VTGDGKPGSLVPRGNQRPGVLGLLEGRDDRGARLPDEEDAAAQEGGGAGEGERDGDAVAPTQEDDARFLTAALEQTLVVAARYAEDEASICAPLREGRVLVRVPSRRGDATVWSDVVEEFETPPPPAIDPLPDEVLRALEMLPQRPEVLDLAHTFLPGVVRDRKGERGMLARILLLVDPARRLIVGQQVFDREEFPRTVVEKVAEMLFDVGCRPVHLMLSDPWLHRVLGAAMAERRDWRPSDPSTAPQRALGLAPK
jgi:hypothetical protein